MEYDLLDQNGCQISKISLLDAVFSREYNEALVHQVVVSYLANSRQGSRAQKNRSSVSYSTRKPWKQKGTGRARAGMRSSPLWRGGGKIFPSSPSENFCQKINRKMYRAAMGCICSRLVSEGRVSFVDKIDIPLPKTKEFLKVVSALGLPSDGSRFVVVTAGYDENLDLSSRNLHYCDVVDSLVVDPVTLVNSRRVLMTEPGLRVLEESLS
ncbi:50S ribosomal protein L4 [Candidatus Ichthyocystis hellenicum]|uniref:50S ribosomal protein L4 n=1 Tax=Candidatus Ichthyocystis hellenicum TaxID=1561003 RepID=UPI000AFAF95E|nr:50S ribosomal protein L4 [Candidatus Ichthyocystis hellenicum]